MSGPWAWLSLDGDGDNGGDNDGDANRHLLNFDSMSCTVGILLLTLSHLLLINSRRYI